MELKSLHVGCSFFPYKGGSSVRLGTLIRNQTGIKSFVCTPTLEEDGNLHGTAGIFRFPANSINGIGSLREVVKTVKPNVSILHNPRAILLWAIFVDPLHRIPRITEIHNFRDETPAKSISTGMLYRKCDAVVVLSNKAKEFSQKKYNLKADKIFVIRNGVTAANQHKSVAHVDAKVVFSYIGSLYLWQGIEIMGQALLNLPEEFWENARVVIAGGGPAELDLKTLLRPLIDKKYVNWLGWIPGKDAELLTRDSDVILMPRIRTLGTEHVVPLKVMESMRAGKAIIASDVGGLTEVLVKNQNAIIVPAGDANALAIAMMQLLRDPSLVKVLGNNAYNDSMGYGDWMQQGELYETLLKSLAK